MRILVVIYEFPPVGGGGGQAAKDICLGLASRGHEVRVITSHLKGLPKHETIGGVDILRVSSGRRRAFQANLMDMSGFVITGIWAGMQMIKEWQPDIIHVHFAVPSGPVAWILRKLTHTPYVLTAHLGDVPGGVPEKTHKWFRWVYPFTPSIWESAAQVVAVSEFTRLLARQHYPVEPQVIPNGVDLAALDPGEICVNQPPRIIFAGRFMAQKNPVGLVNILAEQSDQPWRCTMLGDGPLREDALKVIREHHLEERFTLPGWVSTDEVIKWLAQSDILFMPSLSEGLPVVGVQALAMGLAIVASRIGGFTDLVNPGHNGYLVDSHDQQGFGEVFRGLLSDQDLIKTQRVASRNHAKLFDINRVIHDYEALFSSVIRG
jgi:glycosyltransferase involved in cell wall biosynthesis